MNQRKVHAKFTAARAALDRSCFPAGLGMAPDVMVAKNLEALDPDKDGTVSLAEINTYEATEKSHSAKAKQQ
jgi:hypothetical protein